MTIADRAGVEAAEDARGRTDAAYDALLEMLMSAQVEPGAPLRTEALAAEIGVSATPVREALARLEATGLVLRSARRGYRAAPLLSGEELRQLVEVRLLVEPGIAAMACRRTGPGFLERLRAVVREQREAPTGPGYPRFKAYLEADWSFHVLLAEGSGNPFVRRTLDSFRGFVQRLHQVEDHVEDAQESAAEHTAIADAIAAGDAEAAAEAMRAHLHQVLERAVPPAVG
ncbi:GntR family transcriptional regulator [Kineococcus gynurae]|uniref:GntR family transcriptional regulator n=1 Tax=Kineococcus gynurae TaxID=452979 RepID=A0ABV5LX86_9ACTN